VRGTRPQAACAAAAGFPRRARIGPEGRGDALPSLQ